MPVTGKWTIQFINSTILETGLTFRGCTEVEYWGSFVFFRANDGSYHRTNVDVLISEEKPSSGEVRK